MGRNQRNVFDKIPLRRKGNSKYMEKQTVTFAIPKELHQKLKSKAIAVNEPMYEVVIRAIERELSRLEKGADK